jgi:hypothetical protein
MVARLAIRLPALDNNNLYKLCMALALPNIVLTTPSPKPKPIPQTTKATEDMGGITFVFPNECDIDQ